MKFDLERYRRESQEPDFIAAQRARDAFDYETAADIWMRAYQNGNVLATVKLGLCFFHGWRGCESDEKKAAKLFEEGMRRGCPLAAEWLAECYRTGSGVPADEEKAGEIMDSCWDALEEMCEAGDADAMYACGFCLLHGHFVKKDERRGMELLEKTMELGKANAIEEIAKAYFFGNGVEQDEQKGVALLEQYAYMPDCAIHFALGTIYYNGLGGVEQDYAKALEHLLIPAECGDAVAQRVVGFLLTGAADESLRDDAEAEKWLRRAGKR